MPIHKTCAFSNAPIEEDKEVVVVYISKEQISNSNYKSPDIFSSSDYTYAWDNFKVIGFPLMGKFLGRSKIEYHCETSCKVLLSVINNESEKQYVDLNDLNHDILTEKYKSKEKSKNKTITMFLMLKEVFDLLTSEKREREHIEKVFKIPKDHNNDDISYLQSLIENKNLLSNLKEKNISLLNEEIEYIEDIDKVEKNLIRELKFEINSGNALKFKTGKSIFEVVLELEKNSICEIMGVNLTNLYWVVFSFNNFRKMLLPTMHSYENRNYSELANFNRKLADIIEQQYIGYEDVKFTRLEKQSEYLIKKDDLLLRLKDFDDDYAKEILSLFEKNRSGNNSYRINTKKLSEYNLELLFNGDLFQSSLNGSILLIK